MSEPLRVLHLEDNPTDAKLIASLLTDAGIVCQTKLVDTREAFVAALESETFQLILSDYSLPSFDGLSALTIASEKQHDVPFIFVSGTVGEEQAIEMMRHGATDYALKVRLSRLVPVVQRALSEVKEKKERKRAEETLRQSEERYHDLYDNAPTMLASVDHVSGKVIECNNTLLKRTGFERSEVIGSHILERYHPDCIEKAKAAFDKFIEYGEVHDAELELLTVLGGKIPVLLNVLSVRDEAGMILHSRSVLQDITERRRAEEKIRQSEERYRAVANSANDSIITIDEAGIIIGWNQGATRTFGYNEKEILGQTMDMLMPESYRDGHKNGLNRLQKGGEPRVIGKTVELEGKRKDDSVFPLELSLAEWKTNEGCFFTGIMRDITERKLAIEKQRILEAEIQQAQKLESIGTLAGGIAHDFNNILGIIVAYGSLLQRGNFNTKDLREYTDTMMKAAERGAALVKQILTFARKSDVSVESVQVNYVVKELIGMLHQMFPKTIGFSEDLDKSLPIISIDSGQLNQALMNLCVNARDAILEANKVGKMQSTISIRTTKVTGEILRKRFSAASSEQYISVSVSDTGVGMDEKTKQRIFEPFFTTKEQGKGTGLGLAVVYGIVHSHRGIIDLESELGKGTTFTLYFPVPKDVSGAAALEKTELEEISGGSETILVVEDEEALRMLLKSLLQAKGYTVITASDGLEGVALFEKNKEKVAAVVSDHGLPGINGADAVKKMIASKRGLKCIIASGYMEPQQKSETFKSGVKEFVQKPYDPLEVVRKVREVLDLNG